jgi:chromosome segregation ATPase
LAELKFLSGCVYLNDVAFAGSAGNNPVCNQGEYFYTVVKALPSLKFLDQKPVHKSQELENPKKSVTVKKPDSPEKVKKNSEDQENQEKVEKNEKVEKELFKEVEMKTKENKKLENDLEELYSAYKELSYKFRNNEEFWTTSSKKLEEQASKLATSNKELDSECKRLRRKLLAKTTKVNDLKTRLNSLPLPNPAKEKAFEDIHFQIANLMKDLGESQRTAQQALDEVYKKQEKLKISEKKNYEQKAEIKKLESLLKDLHNKSLESAQQALKKFEDLQIKFQESQSALQVKEGENEALRQKYLEIMDLNAKFDENWATKYREAIHSRETQISSLREELSRCTLNEKSKTQELIFSEKEENRSKIWELEQRVMNLNLEFQEKLRINDGKFTDLIRENSDLKEMLKLSVEKEVKSRECIEDLTDLIKQLQVQLDKELTEKNLAKKSLDDQKKDLEAETLSWKSKFDSLKTRMEITEKDAHMSEDSVHIKNREIARLKRELTESSLHVEDLEEKLKTIKLKMEKNSNSFEREIEELQEQVKELDLSLNTKNVIIDDQNESIKEMKNLISQYELEIDNFNNKKNTHKENYQRQLTDAYDEIETLKSKLLGTENVLTEIESQVIDFQNKKNEYEEEISELQKQIKEKNEVLEYVEVEISGMKKEKDIEIAGITQEKDVIINDLKKFRDELTSKSIHQERELKEKTLKIKELENDLQIIALELKNECIKNENMQEEIKALLREMDNQKKQASEKISQLSKMFS